MLSGKKSQVSAGSAGNSGAPVRQRQVRLSDSQQRELVQRHREGAFKKELARVYGVHVETVRAIVKRYSTGEPNS
ncbi:hypothetical protein [Pimelobacter simplex]|uniref:hypothetical protein n=1 Tax=Nocardioides simplex TaxID=2045 RepID=UPI00214F8F69|nr:hypothetical protein [Pimelobacter simplex]UUW88634.1 hypothetical protein M0M43_23260 [Pimelobacter simplex]UUW98139.1 hypothetical protein M0M48_11910 [Pimelobacter simplex]